MEKEELLWHLYSDHMTHARHLEGQRSTVTTILLAVASGILTVASVQWEKGKPVWVLGALLVAVGLLGVAFAGKLYAMFLKHYGRASFYRVRLGELVPDAQSEKLRKQADAENRVFVFSRIPVSALWLGPFILIIALGVFVLGSHNTPARALNIQKMQPPSIPHVSPRTASSQKRFTGLGSQ